MIIGYIAKHDSGGNDDEGAITHALRGLGHEVRPLRESHGRSARGLGDCDFYLFHKWKDVETLSKLKGKKVFWWFDRVYEEDPSLTRRNADRRGWMGLMTPHTDLGFCTDGDWVDQDKSGKLVWLPQGADVRVAGAGAAKCECPVCGRHWQGVKILFLGRTSQTGRGRNCWFSQVGDRYSCFDFKHIPEGVYGREAANLIAGTRVNLAPAAPVSNRYWSNRVYVTLGFGGFLLHPYSAGLAQQYQDREEIVFYRSLDDMYALVEYYLGRPAERQNIAKAGLERTLREHTYTHRCRELIRVVRERLF